MHFKNLKMSRSLPSEEGSLGIVSEIQGPVELLSYNSPSPQKLKPGQDVEIHHMDLLQTHAEASAVVKLPSGYELKLKPDSKLLFEAWSSEARAPTYLHVLAGSYEMLRAGQRGQVFVQQNRKLIYPEGNVFRANYELAIKAPEYSLPGAASKNNEEEGEEEPKTTAPQKESSSTEIPETLSNDEIDQVLANQRLQFERCQTNALRENLPAQGKILVGISVANTGKVQEVRTLSSDLNNPSLQNCILSVFERVQFRTFKGPTIQRSYPLVFD
jgi:hypothetical protein